MKQYNNISIITVITVITVLLFTNSLYSQQIPLYSQYYLNPFIYNPAMTGSAEKANAFLTHRSQWTDMPGAPVTTALTLDGPVKEKKIGLGFSLFNDVTDITERVGVYASYSYRANISNSSSLLFGLSLGALDNRIDFSKVIVNDKNDPSLFREIQRRALFDGSFGIMYLLKKLEVGVAVPQIMGNSFEYVNNNFRTFYNLTRHYLASVKYTFVINAEKDVSVYPLVLMRYAPGAPVQYDINAVLNLQNIGWLAASYRSNYAVGLNAGIRIKNRLSIGYAYDYITSSISKFAGTSHEIMLGYTFDVSPGGKYKDVLKYENILDSLMAKLSAEQGGAEQQYKDAIAMADKLFIAKDYLNARAAYNEALRYKPDAEYPKFMLNEIDKLIEEKYNDAVAEADKFFMDEDYNIAKAKYKEALSYKPDAQYPKDMIAEIDKLRFTAEKRKGDIEMSSIEDFVSPDGKPVAPGFYVIMAAFRNEQYAERLRQEKGYDRFYNKKREFHYVWMKRNDSYDQAREELLNKARPQAPDSWIYILR